MTIRSLNYADAGAMSRTVTRDCYDGAALHKANSLVSMGVIFSPLLARLVIVVSLIGGGFVSLAASLMGAKDQFNLGSVMLVAAVLVVNSLLWEQDVPVPVYINVHVHVLGNEDRSSNVAVLRLIGKANLIY